MVSWLQLVVWEQSWANRAGGRFIDQMRRMSVCQTSYSSDRSWHVHCMWPRGSLSRVIDQRCISWEAAKSSQQFPFLSCVNSFLSEQKTSFMHSSTCVCPKGTSMTNCSSIFFSWLQKLPGNDAMQDVACRQTWMALAKGNHDLSLFLGPDASL